jgi:hypothetical protein
MRWIVFWLALSIASPSAAEDTSNVVGTWKLLSLTVQYEGEAPTEIFGSNPQGYLILTREGRLMIVITADKRKQGTTEADQAALFTSMNAYTGRYTLHGDQFVTKVQVASQAAWVGTDQVRFFKVAGDRLMISAPPQPSTRRSDHKLFTQEIIWERAE